MADENIKRLPPEERIKKLKELEQKKKQELAEAEREIRESQKEITERRRWVEKIPIPEVAKEELEGLSAEGKQLLKTHKGTKEKPKEESFETEEKETGKKEKQPSRGTSKLEETLWQEKVARVPEAMKVEYGAQAASRQSFGGEYKPLSQQSTTNLYQEMNSMKQSIEEKGYISRADERKAEYLSGIVEERMKSVDRGTYSFTEETARAASLTQMIGHNIRDAYKKSSGFEHDWYKGR